MAIPKEIMRLLQQLKQIQGATGELFPEPDIPFGDDPESQALIRLLRKESGRGTADASQAFKQNVASRGLFRSGSTVQGLSKIQSRGQESFNDALTRLAAGFKSQQYGSRLGRYGQDLGSIGNLIGQRLY